MSLAAPAIVVQHDAKRTLLSVAKDDIIRIIIGYIRDICDGAASDWQYRWSGWPGERMKKGEILERIDFVAELQGRGAIELAADYLRREVVTAFSTAQEYEGFRDLVRQEVGIVEFVAIVGTGNWKYSLNPYKEFKEFDYRSDIDVAVISDQMFHATWEELRSVHRKTWYRIGQDNQKELLRYGQNVYSGFVTPAWIPGPMSALRYRYKSMLNRLSNQSPGQREVKMMYFKNETEAIDYYTRGFTLAQRKVSKK